MNVQNTYFDVETRFVVPLHSPGHFQGRISDLVPTLLVAGQPMVMNTCAMRAVPVFEMGRAVTNHIDQQGAIQNALNTLFSGD